MASIACRQDGEIAAEERLPLKVLIVDDDEEDIYLLKRLLRRSKSVSYAFLSCCGLDEGRAIAAEEHFDVLFVDFFLGIDIAIDSGRPRHALLDFPFVLLSGLDAPDLVAIARESGALGFLCKSRLTSEVVDDVALKAVRQPLPARP
jgi:CheY-like chemotaxis protein